MKKEQIQGIVRHGIDVLPNSLESGQSDTLQSYLKTMVRFPRYSLCNSMLIAMQRPHASQVAGFHAWRQLGRYVKRGEKGISILAPIVIRREIEDDKEGKVIAFKTAHVYDVEQTDGKPLPELSRATGDPGRYLDELKATVKEKGIALDYMKLPGSTFGVSAGGRIVLRSGMDQSEEFSVLLHELAHEMLHQANRDETSRTVKETEAEAVAFVVSEVIGLDAEAAAGDYIQLYDGDKTTLMESLHRIHEVATDILGSIGVIETRKKRSEEEKLVAVRAAA